MKPMQIVALASLLCLVAAGAFAQDSAGTIPQERAIPTAAVEKTESYNRPIRGVKAELPASRTLWHGSGSEALYMDASGRALYDHYLEVYSRPSGEEWLKAVMHRGEPYLSFIYAKAAEYGIPPELAWLPVIESGFQSSARSRSGAVGIWQFMKNSVRPFGIQIDDWVDERRDFWKATDAAFRKLNENYRYFGDWSLALAAYNAGLGAVDRATRKAGVRDYWVLCDQKRLRPETIHYVPKFLAVATVLSRAGRNGLELGWPEEPAWTRITVGRSVDLGLLADYSKVPVSRLRQGNAELNYGVTPNDKNYQLKIWARDREAIEATLARKELQLIKYYFHIVKSGDTLSALSRHYGVSVEMIERSNPGLTARYLKLGAKIVVPALKDVGPYVQAPRDDSGVTFNGTHVVQKGDTLWSISLACDVDPELLAEANGLTLNSVLSVGKTIKTPIISTRP